MKIEKAEALLVGKAYDEKLFEEVQKIVLDEIDPVADIHATAETRKHQAGVLAKRMVKKAWERAKA
jgi:CO/xanthine dehydrogenase FAD-binding subunit